MAYIEMDFASGGGGSGELHGAELVITTEETTLAGELVELYKDDDPTPVQVNRFSTVSSDGKYSVRFVIQEVGTYKVESSDGIEPDPALLENIIITSDDIINKLVVSEDLSFFTPKPWSTASITTIQKMLDKHYAGEIDITDYWAIGDARTLELPSIPTGGYVAETQPEQTVELVIIGLKHDNLSDGSGKAAITVQLLNPLSETGQVYTSNSTAPKWVGCPRRSWCNDSFYNAIPLEIRELVKQVKKEYNTSDAKSIQTAKGTCDDYVFFLSGYEVHGEYVVKGTNYSSDNGYINTAAGSLYEYYDTLSNVQKGKKWGTRDICNGTGQQITCIDNTKLSGYSGKRSGLVSLSWAYGNIYICPAFCL